ncbi:hypothetical protein ATANTOWER_019174 [Ataeniobius toweri]|uniref:Secreted protein n=1 Tax=Ataeniobius toweri TaxID=208326 RepID=A0ABU7CHH8_9TELE|nr:hypothetical protein [Ataeniobius toweri]
MEFACSLRACVGSHWVLRLPPTVQRHACLSGEHKVHKLSTSTVSRQRTRTMWTGEYAFWLHQQMMIASVPLAVCLNVTFKKA